jgi:transketolase
VAKALEAATALARDGIETRVLNMPTLKPLDEEAIVSAAAETGAVVVAEEHLAHGGLGGRVAEVTARRRPVPMSFVNLGDVYALSGKPDELLKQYRLTEDDIYAKVHQVVQRKRALSDGIPSQRS